MKKQPGRLFGFGLAAAVLMVGCQGAGMKADWIIVNGKIWTVDAGRPWAEAVAGRDGRIAAVGTNGEIRRLAGAETQTIDLKGAFVLPGFIDSHVHFINGGLSRLSIQLRDASSRADFAARIGAKARELPPGEWILNGDWDHQRFAPVELPRREWIDALTPDHPVCVNRLDGHMVLCNSLALRLGGVTRNTLPPAGGEIVKDPLTGEPTGILKEAAMDLVLAHVPAATPVQIRRAAEAALAYAAERGVTSVHDVSGEAGIDVYQDLRAAGRLTTRIYFFYPMATVDAVLGLKLKNGFGDETLRFAGMKGFADGSLGSATAYFFEPYTDESSRTGLLAGDMFPAGIMEKRVRAADQAGLQCAVHAIGDRANAVILDFFEAAAAGNTPRDRRFRIEHAQHIRPADFDRFARIGVIASVQPYHAIDDGRWAETKIGPRRARTTYPFRSFLDHGVRLAFGSDWPVAPMDPIMGLYAAVTRRTLDEKHPDGWIPEQKIPLEAAIRAYTTDAAYAEFSEGRKGAVKPGFLADFVVLDRNLFDIKPEEIRAVRVLRTICGGRTVFEAR
jgi:predicted amidohydrolase YtcJ